MSEDITTTVSVDTTEADAELDQLEQHAQMTAAEVFRQTRRTFTTLTLVTGILGHIIPAWFTMMFNAVMTMAEVVHAVAVAETLTGIGLIKAGFTFAAGALLFAQGVNIAQQKDIAHRELNNTMALLNMYGGISGLS
jgi:hypothetical protein